MNPGATASTRAITRSAYASSSSRFFVDAHSCGTHCVNIDTTCWPSGASVGSNTDGMQMSAKGSAAARPADRVLERALDVVERLGEHDRAAVHLGIEAGLGGELGQPVDRDVDLHGAAAGLPALDRVDEVVGQLGAVDLVEERDLRVRRRDHDVGAQLLARLERHAAHATGRARRCARPARRCGPSRRSRAPRRAARRSPRPCRPRGSPTTRAARRPASPILWCAITYAVPGERGPAHVPITPLTDSTPCICGDANHSSSRSAMLDVNRRVTSPTPATPSRRSVHTSRAWSTRSRGRSDPSRGGIVSSNGPSTFAESTEPRVPPFVRVGVGCARTARSRAWRRRRSSGSWSERPSGRGRSSRAADRSCSRGARARARARSSAE